MICETPSAIIGELKVKDLCHICEKPSPGLYKYCEECREKADKVAKKENPDLLKPGYECVLAHKANEYLYREELLKIAGEALPKFDNPGHKLRTILNQIGSPCELNRPEWYEKIIDLEGEELLQVASDILKAFTYDEYNQAISYFKNKIHYQKTGETLPEEETPAAEEPQKEAPPPEKERDPIKYAEKWNFDKPSGWTWFITERDNKYCPQCETNTLFWSNTKNKRLKCSNCGIIFKDAILEKCKKEEEPDWESLTPLQKLRYTEKKIAEEEKNEGIQINEEAAMLPPPEGPSPKKQQNKEFKEINISEIIKFVQVRTLKEGGVEKLRRKIEQIGYSNSPILVRQYKNGYKLLDGNHRVEAMKRLGKETIPAKILKEDLSDSQEKQIARRENEATETLVPTTFVDDAEFIWHEIFSVPKTQQEVAEIMGWSRDKIAKYVALKGITDKAWEMIVTTIQKNVTPLENSSVTMNVTAVTITENLLREILPLSPDQQIELVQLLIENKINKKQFKTRAQRYKTINDLHNIAACELVDLGEHYLSIAFSEIERGLVQTESQLENLIKALREEWQQKNSIQLLQDDFYKKITEIPDNSVDLILTDPPYNCSSDTILAFEDREDISLNFFGEEDQLSRDEYLERIFIWAKEFTRILKDTGICIIFCQHKFLESIGLSFEAQGLQERNVFVWCKTNPAPKVRKNSLGCATEFALIFSKAEGYTFNWLSQKEMFNYFVCPICNGGSTERLKDENGKTLHPTQKPEKLINHLMTIFSNRGDLVFDGFFGTGTTAAVAKVLGRKFVGFEKEEKYCLAAQKRLAD